MLGFSLSVSDGIAIVEDGLQNGGVVFVVAVSVFNHLHEPEGHLTAHFEALLHRAGDALLTVGIRGVVKADQGVVRRDLLPHSVQGVADVAVDDVIAADNGGALGQTF